VAFQKPLATTPDEHVKRTGEGGNLERPNGAVISPTIPHDGDIADALHVRTVHVESGIGHLELSDGREELALRNLAASGADDPSEIVGEAPSKRGGVAVRNGRVLRDEQGSEYIAQIGLGASGARPRQADQSQRGHDSDGCSVH
jgi:hypothetical protein